MVIENEFGKIECFLTSMLCPRQINLLKGLSIKYIFLGLSITYPFTGRTR